MLPKRPHASLTFDPEVLAAAREAAHADDLPLSTWLNRLVRAHLGVKTRPLRNSRQLQLPQVEPAGDGS